TPPEMGLEPIEAANDPHRLARHSIIERFQHADGLILRFWRDEWHLWNGSFFSVLPEKELRAELTASAKAEMDRINLIAQKLGANEEDSSRPTVRKVTGRLIEDVAHAMVSLTVLPSRKEAPTWIKGNGPFPAGEILAC